MRRNLQAIAKSVEKHLTELTRAKLKPLDDLSRFPKTGGVYVVYDGKSALYAGIATNLKRRFHQHIEDRRVASALTVKLAFLEAKIVKVGGRYPKSRQEFFKDANYLIAYRRAAHKVRRMKARFIEVNSAPVRIILEAYAGMLLKTKLNDFNMELEKTL
ncbi:MAG: GIY-YIG nuclease family protein [Xanthobacteraceae bacterium]|nr:GIY-YIG nuclease family protein [Xanthobacteraceae bacterium]QYK44031.1 MAG: GIY-YIG nuclease family protein [Xanthobacteraceae bacterium]